MEKQEQIKTLNKVISIIDTLGVDIELRPYSGRFMEGAQCLGFSISGYEFDELCKILDRRDIPYRAESLGLGMVVYFPTVEYKNVSGLIHR